MEENMYKKLTILAFSAVLFSSAYSMTGLSNAIFGDPTYKKCMANRGEEKDCKKFAARVESCMKKNWKRAAAEKEVAREMGE